MANLPINEHLFEWFGIREDACILLTSVFCNSTTAQIKEFEQKVYSSIAPKDSTRYHMQLYKEIMTQIGLASPTTLTQLWTNFNQFLPTFIQSFTSHISTLQPVHNTHDTHDTPVTYTTKSEELFYTHLHPQLKKLELSSHIKLPPCPDCKTTQFMTTTPIQVRSADEAMDIFPQCTKCKKVLMDHKI